MYDVADNMVLRSVYLPPDLDRDLKSLAFTRGVSKADLIRELVTSGMREQGGTALAKRISAIAKARKAAALDKAARTRAGSSTQRLIAGAKKTPAKKASAKKVSARKSTARKTAAR